MTMMHGIGYGSAQPARSWSVREDGIVLIWLETDVARSRRLVWSSIVGFEIEVEHAPFQSDRSSFGLGAYSARIERDRGDWFGRTAFIRLRSNQRATLEQLRRRWQAARGSAPS